MALFAHMGMPADQDDQARVIGIFYEFEEVIAIAGDEDTAGAGRMGQDFSYPWL